MDQALGYHRLAEVKVQTSGTSDKALGLLVLLIGVAAWSRQEEKDGELLRQPPVLPTDPISPGDRDMGCGSTGAALDRVADWSVLTDRG